MGNASMRLKCPDCGEGVNVRVTVCGGYAGDYFNPPEPPELEDVDEILFEDCECDLGHGHVDERGIFYRYETEEVDKKFWANIDSQIETVDFEIDVYEPYGDY